MKAYSTARSLLVAAMLMGCSGSNFEPALACSGEDCADFDAGGADGALDGRAEAASDAPSPDVPAETFIETRPDATDARPETTSEDAGDAALGPDTTIAVDSATDTISPPPDTFALDTAVGDSSPPIDTSPPPDTGVVDTFVPDTAGCGPVTTFGLSEIMVRAVAGSSDAREWLELTNYDKCPRDISGFTVKIVSGALERAAFTFPAGTVVAAGEAIAIATDEPTFSADVTTSLGRVFSFGKPGGDVLVNSASFSVRIFAPGSSSPYEDATIPSRTWLVGRSFTYPMTCLPSKRILGTSLGAGWRDAETSSFYGSYMGAMLYGSPTRGNSGDCPG